MVLDYYELYELFLGMDFTSEFSNSIRRSSFLSFPLRVMSDGFNAYSLLSSSQVHWLQLE